MKAAVMYPSGGAPQYADHAEPQAQQDDEVLVQVKAVAVKHLDKGKASGQHYSSVNTGEPKIIGSDGVAVLQNGQRVYGIGVDGTMAEKALFRKNLTAPVPDGLSDSIASALPNALMGSAMGLRFRAKLQSGDTVLVNGATGFTGKVAVQIAKHYGAGKIIATGRNEESLQSLLSLGADEIISLKQDDDAFAKQIKAIHAATPVNVVIDYLWGHSAELMLAAFKGNGNFSAKTRYVSIGAMTGDTIQLSSQILRSTDIQLFGSGLGSWTKEELGLLFKEILPDAFQLAVEGNLKINVKEVPLKHIDRLWHMEVPGGERLVVVI